MPAKDISDTPLWWFTKDGDQDCAEMYERHYSSRKLGADRHCDQIIGPGEKLLLRTERADAMFVWRKFIDDSGQQGINCAVFRNESPHLQLAPYSASGSDR